MYGWKYCTSPVSYTHLEQYGKDVAYVVLDHKGNVLVDSTYNGFDDVVKQKILDSLHPPVQEQTEGYKPKLDNWQKYMENGEYLRSAEITEEANYNMIDGLKNLSLIHI